MTADNLDEIPVIKAIDIESIPPASVQRYWLYLTSDGIGTPQYIPVIIVRGINDKHLVGITAAIHGNELNGIPVIQRLIGKIDPTKLEGVLICIPVTNVPAFLRKQRDFLDGKDLNRIMPGNQLGNESDIYAYRLISRVINELDYLIDLHTASFGNINSFYVRANMNLPDVAQMACMLNPQIIVHKKSEGTLRYAAEDLGIHAVTVEIGDPNRFQESMISNALEGILNTLKGLGMIKGKVKAATQPPVECDGSYWLHTNQGGLVDVYPELADFVEQGEVVARVYNVFGDVLETYQAPESGIVIGKNTYPVNQTGGRILHLGIPVD